MEEWKEIKEVIEKFGKVQVFRRGGEIYFKLRFPTGSEVEFGMDNVPDVVKFGVVQEVKRRLGWKPLGDFVVGRNVAAKVRVLDKGIVFVNIMTRDRQPLSIIRMEELDIDRLAQLLQEVDALCEI